MFNINTDPAPSSLYRLKLMISVIALGAALPFPAAAHAMEDIAIVDFQLIDRLMAADQENAVSDGLLTPPELVSPGDTSKYNLSGPLQEEPEYPKGAGTRFYPDIPPRSYASFGEDVKAIKWELAAVAGYYTAINAPKLLKDPSWPTTHKEG